jgi:hypothetical protein
LGALPPTAIHYEHYLISLSIIVSHNRMVYCDLLGSFNVTIQCSAATRGKLSSLSYGETPLVNCGPRSNFLYIAITVYFYSHYLLSCILLPFYHSIRLILCLQQTGEIDNLIVSCGKVLSCVVCRFHLLLVQSKALDEAPYKLSGTIAKLACINLLKFGFLLLVR